MLVLLYADFTILAYAVAVMALIEGLTNQRLNIVITRLRRKLGADMSQFEKPLRENYKIPFDAERAQRLFVAISFGTLLSVAPKEYWILSWLFAFGMLISGIVMFCPVIAFFRAIGFR